MDDINKMKLHEVTHITTQHDRAFQQVVFARKVETGWIYEYYEQNSKNFINSIFVPGNKDLLKSSK